MCITKIFTVTKTTPYSKNICGVYQFIEDCFDYVNEINSSNSDVIEWQIDVHTLGIANSETRIKTIYMQTNINNGRSC